MNTSKPTVSIVIPCYNGAPFLRETLESALNQTAPPLEIIVIDDGSTDDSALIAESFGSPVRVIRQENQGESVARNRGIDEAKGDWIALLDADDLWEPDKLELQLQEVQKGNEDLVCVFTSFYFLYEDGSKELPDSRPRNDLSPDFAVKMLLEWVILPSTSLIRSDAAAKTRFPDDIKANEDAIFFTALRFEGSFAEVQKPLVYYRRQAGQQTSKPEHYIEAVFSRLSWFEDHRHLFSESAQIKVTDLLYAQLIDMHDTWYWKRNHRAVKLVRQSWPENRAMPPSFNKSLRPVWFMKFKDRVDELLNR